MADNGTTRRVELVAAVTPDRLEAGRTGVGLLIGLWLGRSSLIGAATGSERFEMAMAHFVVVVLVSVAGVLLLGVLWDRSKPTAEPASAMNDEPTDGALEPAGGALPHHLTGNDER